MGTLLAVVVAAGAVVWTMGMRTPGEASACQNPDEVSAGAEAAMSPALEQAASRIRPEDADAETLKKISAATGGTSHVARAPEDIPGVFADALLARIR